MTRQWMRFLAPLGLSLMLSSTATAGPVEVLDSIAITPGNPDAFAVRYREGGGGLLVTDDGGDRFRFLCGSAIDPSLRDRDIAQLFVASDGAIFLPVFNGLWKGDSSMCGAHKVPAFEGKWVRHLTADPFDQDVLYATTSAGGQPNGIYRGKAGSEDWELFGALEEILIGSTHVVKHGDARRLYQSIVRGELEVDDGDGGTRRFPRYLIRVSDDDAATWTEHEYGPTDSLLQILAVDPTDNRRLVIGLDNRAGDDELVWSADQGKPDSFESIAMVGELGGVSFAPDGRLFYGDRSFDGASLHVLSALGKAPTQLASGYKAGCVHYDPQREALYVCQDRDLGTVDLSSGEFEPIFDFTKAEAWVECADHAASTEALCAKQLEIDYCNYTHYPDAPICEPYNLPGPPGGSSGSGGSAAAGGSGGSADAGPADAGDTPAKDSGCSVSTLRGGQAGGWQLLGWGLLACVITWRRGRRVGSARRG